MQFEENFIPDNYIDGLLNNHIEIYPDILVSGEEMDCITKRLVSVGYERFAYTMDIALYTLSSDYGIEVALDAIDSEIEYRSMDLDTPAQVIGVAPEILLQIYSATQDLMLKEEFEKAAACALLLVTLNPAESAYWIALGITDIYLKRYVAAAYAFGSAIKLGAPINSYIYAVRAFVQCNQLKIAKKLIESMYDLVATSDKAMLIRMKQNI